MKLRISKVAAQDIEDIYQYGFHHFGEAQADDYMALLEKRFALLCTNPEIGRLDTRTHPAVYRFDSDHHVIFYDIVGQTLLIVRVLHAHMDFIKHLSSPL